MAIESTGGQLRGFTHRVLIVAVIAVLFLFLWQIVHALLFAFIGILLAILWRSLAGVITRFVPVPMHWALLIVAVFGAGLLTAFIWFAGPRFSEQLNQLTQTLPSSVENLRQSLMKYAWGRYLLEHAVPAQLTSGQRLSLFSRVTGAASTIVAVLANLVVVLATAIYFAINPDVYVRGILALIPKDKSDRMREVFDASARTLRHWLLGQALAMLTVGILTTIGLWIAGVPLAFLLGVIAGLLDFVPYVGSIGAAIPGILLGLAQSPMTGVYASIVYLAVQQVEGQLVVPMVQKRTVWLPPAMVILAVVVFGLLFGLLGVLVATPLTAVATVWIRMLYVHDVLGRRVEPD
jgi:predicted PurR-regulated permease PerM